MSRYKFTTKISKEAIAMCTAENYERAVEIFATNKNLTVEEFLKIYDVVELEEIKK